MKILLLSDIHANFPALQAVFSTFGNSSFDYIVNCGDSLVYGPFPNETMHYLTDKQVLSITGNTDRKIKKILKGKTIRKPSNPQKRIMYSWTASKLDNQAKKHLFSLHNKEIFSVDDYSICLAHGSPVHKNEFLFPETTITRFQELARVCPSQIIITGHSHSPYHKHVDGTHFINPGSVGRMFDGNPAASCAILTLSTSSIAVEHFRIQYPIEEVCKALEKANLPKLYQQMYREGLKLN